MRQRDRGSATDTDTYGSLFASVDHADEGDYSVADSLFDDDELAYDEPAHPRPQARQTRVERNRQVRKKGRRRIVFVFVGLLVLVLGLATWLVVIPVYHYLSPKDYSGSGSGSVRITVQSNDGATDIGNELHDKGVVASVRAFTDAANDDSRSREIQPGTYVLHQHMSGSDALKLILEPSSRENDDVVVTEGATSLDVATRLSAAPCSSSANASAICGPGYAKATVQKSMSDVAALGIPADFTVNGKPPASVEGFLYPAKYFFPEDAQPTAALQQMITQFAEQLRSTDFTNRAKVNNWTPYQQLIAASIAQSEAKYPADMAMVVRVILNRITSKTPLKIDATSAYGAKLKGLDPTKVVYATIDSAYNSYTHDGLPPTPISNPGADALAAAAHPAKGNWLYYVNKDAAGHLFFTNSEAAFGKAVTKCEQNHWGCG